MKDDEFQPFMDRFDKRCNDWSEKFMSYAAKEVHLKLAVALPTFTISVFMLSKGFLKSAVHALPTFTMSVFMLSKGFCEKYERMIRDFWWGDEDGYRKVHWISLAGDDDKNEKSGCHRFQRYAPFQSSPSCQTELEIHPKPGKFSILLMLVRFAN